MMSREEAIEIIKGYLELDKDIDSEYLEAQKVVIKALEEQESVLDKIKAEIKRLDGKYLIGDYGIYGENTPKYVRLWDALQIIDEYK